MAGKLIDFAEPANLPLLFATQKQLQVDVQTARESFNEAFAKSATKGTVKGHMEALKADWHKFDSLHQYVMLHSLSDDEEVVKIITESNYKADSVYDTTKICYRSFLCDLMEQLELLEKAALTASLKLESGGEITATPHQQLISNLRRLPKFNGDYTKWIEFRDLFDSMVMKVNIGDAEKLTYLKQYLVGPAVDHINSIKATNVGLERTWTVLDEYYNNQRLIIQAHIAEFYNLAPAQRNSPTDLEKILTATTQALASLDALRCPLTEGLDNHLIVFIVESKLDPYTLQLWDQSQGESTEPSTWDKLKKFLKTRVRVLRGSSAHPHRTLKAQDTSQGDKSSQQSNQALKSFIATSNSSSTSKPAHKSSSSSVQT